MSSIEIHFSGEMVTNHRIPLRALALTLDHIQKAVNRSYLDITRSHGYFFPVTTIKIPVFHSI